VFRQLIDEMTEFNRCWLCRHGYMTYNTNDLHVGRSLDTLEQAFARQFGSS
jgi:hypothetical protein